MFGMTPYEQRKNQVIVRKPRDIFDFFFGDDFVPQMTGTFAASFNADIRELDGGYVIEAEMPGLTKEDIKLDLRDDVLSISAEKKEESDEERGSYIRRERRFGSFTRSFRVEDVKQEEINAKFENGVLRISLPKRDASARQGKTIDIM